MKQLLFFLLLSISVLPIQAQTENPMQQDISRSEVALPVDSMRAASSQSVQESSQLLTDDSLTLSLPWQNTFLPGGFGFDGVGDYPYSAWGSSWRLHKGFNAQFSLSMTAGLGKRAPRGVGFGQTAAFAYLLPLNARWAIGAGIHAQNFDWGRWHTTDVGLSAMAVYRATDRINLYGYAATSFLPRQETLLRSRWREPFPFGVDRPQTRIGAAAEFKVGENAVIGVSVEHRSY